jgi:plastocyanin
MATTSHKGVSKAGCIFLLSVIIIAIIGAAGIGYNSGVVVQQNASALQNDSIQNQINSLENQVSSIQSNVWKLPVSNQTPTTRNFVIEWSLLTAGQDRFVPSTMIVNQGDNVNIVFESNDTDAHTLTIGAPYNFQINASVPGTQDYLLSEKNFTTPPTNNSPGVHVWGIPGNVTGTGSFIAKYAGIYEFFCVYHVQLGMFGYLIVLPNVAYHSQGNGTQPTTPGTKNTSSNGTSVRIVNGAYNQSQPQNFVPNTIVVIIGVNNTVMWTNDDVAAHTVTSDSGAFNSGNLNPGQSFTFTFSTPGNYTYHCDYHPWMKGTVIVVSA